MWVTHHDATVLREAAEIVQRRRPRWLGSRYITSRLQRLASHIECGI